MHHLKPTPSYMVKDSQAVVVGAEARVRTGLMLMHLKNKLPVGIGEAAVARQKLPTKSRDNYVSYGDKKDSLLTCGGGHLGLILEVVVVEICPVDLESIPGNIIILLGTAVSQRLTQFVSL